MEKTIISYYNAGKFDMIGKLIDEKIFVAICENGHMELTKWLLEKYPNVCNKISHHDIINIAYKNMDIVEWLVTHLSINQNNKKIELSYGKNRENKMFRKACRKKYLELVRWFINTYKFHLFIIEDVLECCVRYNCKLEIVELIMDNYPNIDYAYEDDNIFTYACQYGNLEILKWFEEKNLLENFKYDIYNGFEDAIVYGQLEIVEWLIKNIPNIEKNVDVKKGFLKACKNSYIEIAKLLNEKYPELCREYKIKYVFSYAFSTNNLELMKLLKQEYPDINFNNDHKYVKDNETTSWLCSIVLPQRKIKSARKN